MRRSISWVFILLTCIVIFAAIWLCRYQITSPVTKEGIAYKLDRMTGEVTVLTYHWQGTGVEQTVYYYEGKIRR